MISKFRILILAVCGLAALLVFRNIWMRTVASPADLRIHVSFLALGYTLLLGTALQELVRTIASRAAAELPAVTIVRLLAASNATIGYLFGILWATNSGKYDALRHPVLLTDAIVIGLAWFVATKPLRNRPTAYWDIALGLGALSSWYLSTLR